MIYSRPCCILEKPKCKTLLKTGVSVPKQRTGHPRTEICLYDILTTLLHVHQIALRAVLGWLKEQGGGDVMSPDQVYVWWYVLIHKRRVLVRYEKMISLYDKVMGSVLAVWLTDVLTVVLMRLLDRGVDRLDRQLLGEVDGYGDTSYLTVLARADLKSVQRGPLYLHGITH